jgi:hypothetical protein
MDHISQHLCSEKVISAQEIAAFASGLDNIQNIYAEIAERYGIKLDERCEVKKANGSGATTYRSSVYNHSSHLTSF